MFSNHNVECISIKDIKPGLKNINVVFIILDVGPATVTKENREVRNFKVGDPSACINASIWDEPGKHLAPGDIIRLTKGYASIWRHCLTLYSGKGGDIHKIGEFCLTFNEQINMSESKLAHTTNTPIQGSSQLNTNNNGNSNNGSTIQSHRTVPSTITTTASVIHSTKAVATVTRQNSASSNTVNVSESSKSQTTVTQSTPTVVAAPQPAAKASRTSRSNQTRGFAKADRR